MKTRHVSVVAVAAALALAGCSNGSSSTSASPAASNTSTAPTTSAAATTTEAAPSPSGNTETATLNVTLMKDSIPAATQAAAIAEMKKLYPNVTVNVGILDWGARDAKWTAAFSAKPATIDAAEMGNTDVLSWASKDAIAELDPTKFENNATWLDSLKQAGTYDGKFFGVPYYAGSRVLWYNKKLVTDAAPTTLDELQALGAKYKKGDVSGIYMPGRNWYSNTSFLIDAGMPGIAVKDGDTWKGQLASDAGLAGIDRLKKFVAAVSAAPADVDEANDDKIFGQKKAMMVIEPGWWNGVVTAPGPKGQAFPKDDLGAWTIPGTNGPLPQFLGGSNLVVAANSAHKDIATAWIGVLAGTTVQTLIAQAASIPNTTTLFDKVPEGPAKMAANSATGKGWFIPASTNWAEVESSKIMQDFFQKVLTAGTDAKTAATDADKKIEAILNKAS